MSPSRRSWTHVITQSVCASELTISMIFTHASQQRSRPGWGSVATSVQLFPSRSGPRSGEWQQPRSIDVACPSRGTGPLGIPRCNRHRGPMAESTFTHHHQSCSATDGPRTRCSQSCPENTTANPECQRRSFRSHHGPDPVHRAQPNGTTLTESALALGAKQHAPAEIRGSTGTVALPVAASLRTSRARPTDRHPGSRRRVLAALDDCG
jgi:hypothetical protein